MGRKLFKKNGYIYDEYGAPVNLSTNSSIDKVKGFRTKVGSNIVNSSYQRKSQLNTFQRWSTSYTMYPTLSQEKSQYIQTSSIKKCVKNIDYGASDGPFYELTENYQNNTFDQLCSLSNPCIPFESALVKYKPTLLVSVFRNAVNGSTITQFGECDKVVFNAEFSFSLVFKNLKADRYVYNYNIILYKVCLLIKLQCKCNSEGG